MAAAANAYTVNTMCFLLPFTTVIGVVYTEKVIKASSNPAVDLQKLAAATGIGLSFLSLSIVFLFFILRSPDALTVFRSFGYIVRSCCRDSKLVWMLKFTFVIVAWLYTVSYMVRTAVGSGLMLRVQRDNDTLAQVP
jgi:hypothetical protein